MTNFTSVTIALAAPLPPAPTPAEVPQPSRIVLPTVVALVLFILCLCEDARNTNTSPFRLVVHLSQTGSGCSLEISRGASPDLRWTTVGPAGWVTSQDEAAAVQCLSIVLQCRGVDCVSVTVTSVHRAQLRNHLRVNPALTSSCPSI